IDIAKKLVGGGADVVCMCCNTAHYSYDEIVKYSGVDMINLIEEVVGEVKKQNVRSVGLIASEGCLMGRVYERYFDEIFAECSIIYPEDQFQKLVTQGICNIKNATRFDLASEHHPRNIFDKVRNHLISRGADIVVVGCTDVRVAYYDERNIDSLEVMSDLLIRIANE
ncbi:aspartate racemase, partial [Helicobacter pullorum]|uniref:aspartate/glutamate racemase family protein n=2 Tax=Helicobacter pullorum TaxID=35818 RepID=UPI0008169E55